MNERINKAIADRRRELGLTIDDVAKFVGVSKATVSRWESGEIDNMRRDRIAALAKILRVSPLFIMGIDEDDKMHGYYTDPAVAEMANQIKDDPDVRILLDAKKNLSKQDMDIVVGMVKSLLDKERR